MVLLVLLGTWSAAAQAERLKDIASVSGARSNQLLGVGLVVGLDGTGDQTSQAPFTIQQLNNYLEQLGITLPVGVNPQLKNVAAVSVTAALPPFAKRGQTIDVTVSTIGNAKSLRGGTLLMTLLKGADGRVYSVSQGSLVVGGFGVQGKDGSRVSVNVPTVGRIPNGATVEAEVPSSLYSMPAVMLNLNHYDFTTASRVASAVNGAFGEGVATSLDGSSIRVQAPVDPTQRTAFLSMLENLTVDPGEAPARVVINSRTGTVVISSFVRVMPAAVSHGSLTVSIKENLNVSQPGPFTRGADTVVTRDSSIDVKEEGSRMFLFESGVDLNEIVRAVNEVGAAPGDLIAILEALKEVGALRAELMVI